jgi:hypothetical protein
MFTALQKRLRDVLRHTALKVCAADLQSGCELWRYGSDASEE